MEGYAIGQQGNVTANPTAKDCLWVGWLFVGSVLASRRLLTCLTRGLERIGASGGKPWPLGSTVVRPRRSGERARQWSDPVTGAEMTVKMGQITQPGTAAGGFCTA